MFADGFDAASGQLVLALSPDETRLYVVDSYSLYAVDVETGAVTHVADAATNRRWGGGLAVYRPTPLGDLNCDRWVDFFDIDPFLAALLSPSDYAVTWPHCDASFGDMNTGGSVDFLDIDGFVAALFAPQ